MARQFPRFLFSDPTNTKSKGPFIVHTIWPKAILKLVNDNGNVRVFDLEYWDECNEEQKTELRIQALDWAVTLYKLKQIHF